MHLITLFETNLLRWETTVLLVQCENNEGQNLGKNGTWFSCVFLINSTFWTWLSACDIELFISFLETKPIKLVLCFLLLSACLCFLVVFLMSNYHCFFSFFGFDAIVTHVILQNILWQYHTVARVRSSEDNNLHFFPCSICGATFQMLLSLLVFPVSSCYYCLFFLFISLSFFFFYILVIFHCFLHHITAVKWPNVKEQTVCISDISCWFCGTLAWWIAQQKTPNNNLQPETEQHSAPTSFTCCV